MGEILLFGSVGYSFWGEDHFTSKGVNAQLSDLSGPLTVRINSGGGDAVEGQAIHAALVRYPGKVTVVVEGCAASAASLIAMAGDEIVMTPGSWMLIHDPATPWVEGRGTSEEHTRLAAHLDAVADGYASIYADRSGKSKAAARNLMRADTLLTAEEAVKEGFATRVDQDAAPKVAATFDYRIYATAPAAARQVAEGLGAFQGKQAVMAMIAGSAGTATESKMNMRANPTNGEDGGDPSKSKIVMTAHQVTDLHARAARMQVDSAKVNEIIEAGLTFEAALVKVHDLWAGQVDNGPMHGRPTASIGQDFNSPRALAERQADAVAAMLVPRLGVKHEPTVGREFMGTPLLDMKVAQLAAAGVKVRHRTEALQMSTHTGADFPLVIGGGLTAVIRRMAEQQEPAISRCARPIEAEDYRTGNAVSLSGSGVPTIINEGGEIDFTTINDEGEVKAVPADYGQIFRISNQALVNDAAALGQIADIARLMVKGAMELKRNTLLAPLLANSGAGQTMRDTQPLFHSTHGNLAGTGTVISVASIGAARTAMRRQRDSNGILLNVEPRFLLVPPELETLAQQTVTQIMATRPADVNPFGGVLDVVAEPGLTSATAWYLAAEPSQIDGLVMAYLTGNEAPRVDSQEGWGTLGLEFRLIWAIGAAFHAWQSWYLNPGA